MPIYGYRCRNCGHEFEILQRMSDAPLKTCPKCSGELTKILYPAGVIYKGSGYYSTDYKGGGKAGSKSAKNGASSDSDSSGESKPASESKPEARSESKTSESSSSE